MVDALFGRVALLIGRSNRVALEQRAARDFRLAWIAFRM